MKILKLAFIGGAMSLAALSATAETFRWASNTDPQTMDPHAVNSAPVLSFLNNIYEGLVRRNQGMSIEGSLAQSWEPLIRRKWVAFQPARRCDFPGRIYLQFGRRHVFL